MSMMDSFPNQKGRKTYSVWHLAWRHSSFLRIFIVIGLSVMLLFACRTANSSPTMNPAAAATSAVHTQAVAITLTAFQQTVATSASTPLPPIPIVTPIDEIMAQARNWRAAYLISENQIICIENGYGSDGYCMKDQKSERRYFDNLSWSPDGKSLAVSDGSHVYIIAADGSSKVDFTENLQAVVNGDPDWSPDGKYIAFASSRSQSLPDSTFTSDIIIISVDGGQSLNLTSNASINRLPVWSPDGQWIAFISDRELRGTGNVRLEDDIYLVSVDGSNLQKVTDCHGILDIAWSPNGNFIAFVKKEDNNYWHIYIVNRDGSNLRQLTTEDAHVSSFNWLPDARYIAYTIFRSTSTDRQHYVIDMESSQVFPLKYGTLSEADLLPVSP